MPPVLQAAGQSHGDTQELEKPPNLAADNAAPDQPRKEDEQFVQVDHDDVEMQDADAEKKSPADSLQLQRFSNNLADVDEDDESEDDHDAMAHHPLLGMLAGRLGMRRRNSAHKWDHLHPENQVLSVSNVDDCARLEEEVFPEEERASREKFQYRLTRCPELSLGLFSQPTKAEAEKMQSAPVRRLVAHIVATRTPAPCVTEASMAVPPHWRSRRSSLPGPGEHEPLGHQDMGSTVCIHSLAVAKDYQRLGLGSILLKSYIQRLQDAKCADRIALLAHDHLVSFYTAFGFENMGPSPVTSCGSGWNNLILEFANQEEE